MTKYSITAIKKDDGGKIAEVKVSYTDAEGVKRVGTRSVQKVIELIFQGHSFSVKNAEVCPYIRTVPNGSTADNLDSLPEYE